MFINPWIRDEWCEGIGGRRDDSLLARGTSEFEAKMRVKFNICISRVLRRCCSVAGSGIIWRFSLLHSTRLWRSTLKWQRQSGLATFILWQLSLWQLRSSLPRGVAQSFACAIIGSQLDYCNFLYYGMSNINFQRLHWVQNADARIVCQAPRRQHHSVDLLKDLHWFLCMAE